MSDVLERLRDMATGEGRHRYDPPAYWAVCEEAAEEVARLREQVEALRAIWGHGGIEGLSCDESKRLFARARACGALED